MTREYILGGELGPVYVNETGTRQYALEVIFLDETVAAAPPASSAVANHSWYVKGIGIKTKIAEISQVNSDIGDTP